MEVFRQAITQLRNNGMVDVIMYWSFLLILPIVSFLYASIGHGGASGYLALMALFSFSTQLMKPTALVLNLFVSGIAFYHYYREGYFNKKLFFSFAIASIPMAFFGGIMTLDATLYSKILAMLLIIAVIKIVHGFGRNDFVVKKIKIWQGLVVGGAIGFLSGLIGIGGGVILTPVILVLHWGKMKEAAAVSALFIWVNSIAGLLGQLSLGISLSNDMIVYVLVALIGGFFGSYYGSKKFDNKILSYLLAFVLVTASVKLYLF